MTKLEPASPQARWEPDAPMSDLLVGIVGDLANATTALATRLTVGIGHQPDVESINTLRTLARTAGSLQRIVHAEEDRHASRQRARKTSPGAPRKRSLPDTPQVLLLRLEIMEKNKKFRNKKYCDLNPERSAAEAELNTFSSNSMTSLTGSVLEAELNRAP